MVDPLTKRYSRDRFVSSFVGFVPADDPKIALVVVIHEPRGQIYGGLVAAPVFKKIASESLSYLSVPRDDYQERGLLLVSNDNGRAKALASAGSAPGHPGVQNLS